MDISEQHRMITYESVCDFLSAHQPGGACSKSEAVLIDSLRVAERWLLHSETGEFACEMTCDAATLYRSSGSLREWRVFDRVDIGSKMAPTTLPQSHFRGFG